MLELLEVPENSPVMMTIHGNAGTGKTTLAATFPKPIFIRAEDGMRSIPMKKRPKAFPLLENGKDIFQQLSALKNEDHDFKTIVIDSVTQLEILFIKHVMDSDPKKPKSINQAHGGYGNGPNMVASLHHRVRNACEYLARHKDMGVVFLAHTDTEIVEPPDSEPYTRFSLRLGKKSVNPYVDNVDIVGFLRLNTYLTSRGEKKVASSDGTISLTVAASAANVSKNRFGITEDLEVLPGKNPLLEYLK